MARNEEQITNFRIKGIMLFSLLFMLLSSCVPEQKANNVKRNGQSAQQDTNTDTKNPPNDPTYDTSLNYFQNGTDQTTSTLIVNSNFESGVYLRGKSINGYIKNFGLTTAQCLIAYFPNSLGHKYFVTTAMPRYITNLTTNVREYYYWIEPNNKTTNQTFCQTTGIVNELTSLGESIAYSLSDICPSCISSSILSNGLQLKTVSGASIATISITNLTLRLNQSTTNNPGNPIGVTCTSSNSCKALGFECCSEGQCVNDKQVRNGYNTNTPEYQAILELISVEPNRIYDFPEVFYFCSIINPPTPTPVPTVDPERDAYNRFLELKEAYECTTPIDGEMSVCTVSYKNIQNNLGPFDTRADDRNFTTTYTGYSTIPTHSIFEVEAYGVTLFKENEISTPYVDIGPNNNLIGNDNLNDVMNVSIRPTFIPPTNPLNNDIKIRYKIDGSCNQVSSQLARCEKYYVQGQNDGKINDHFPASNQFKLPLYANTNNAIKVEVNGIAKLQGTHYQVVATSPAYVEFLGSGLQVFDSQTVKITFFVQMDTNENLLLSKNLAKQKINNVCGCPDLSCYLAPVYETVNGIDTIKTYQCMYADNDTTEPPLQQTVLLSSKSVPHRYYDGNGVAHTSITFTTPAQEGRAFEYTNNDLLKPNNLTNNIGFNEIYGSLSYKAGSAKPAQEVKVKNARTYDIFVDTGTFSTCYYCGTDYYTNVSKMFPENLTAKGGGYWPDKTATDPTRATPFRKDDLIFGRACFVPASMIPWTHSSFNDLSQQRQRRLDAQHFLFSNGYQRDWYGFDYGSVIGSFDGVKWFSIGNQRRIKSTSTRLYLALNAYFGDLTIDNNYTIVVSDASTVPSSGSSVTNDYESSGAQCQQMHQCNTDRDCASQLGWEYSCEVVSGLRTNWPTFDASGREVPGISQNVTLASLIGTTTGGNKRCVYRGRGAPCSPNYDISNPDNSYIGSSSPKVNACSDNNYCQAFTQGGTYLNYFNNKISRYGKSIKTLNATNGTEHNTFGLESPILGRPLNYIGQNSIEPIINNSLYNNNVTAICLPGRAPDAGTIIAQHTERPLQEMIGDKVNAMGLTPTSLVASDYYLSSCSILDSDNNYYKTKAENIYKSLGDPDFVRHAGRQAISTNSLRILQNLTNIRITKNFLLEDVASLSLENNRCLRAPGASCHTDLDCAPSKYIADRVKSLNADSTSLHGSLNKYEIKFWQEELICSQATLKADENYQLKNNFCCREVGKTITIPTFVKRNIGDNLSSVLFPDFDNTSVPGIDISLDNPRRYSRNAVVYNELSSGTLAPLQIPKYDECLASSPPASCENGSELPKQFKTFALTAERTSCSGHWVRQFASGEKGNGGGNKWGPTKTQNVTLESFRCLNWLPGTSSYTCAGYEDPDDPECLARSVSNSEATPIFDWLMTLELVGIPQVAIKADGSDISCFTANTIIPNFIKDPADTNSNFDAIAEIHDGTNYRFLASDITNFDDKVKRIFSENEVKTCYPAGTEMPSGSDPALCCTGFINGTNNKCQLQDYSNVSLFFNRYVSSAAKNVNDSFFDEKTGFIKSISYVEQLACVEQVCASGVIARGVALSNLKIKGQENSNRLVKRFIDGKGTDNNFNGKASLHEAGLRWNNAVYCVPGDINNQESDIYIINCNGL